MLALSHVYQFFFVCSDEEPPRKKRRSKWDITPPEGATQTSSKGTGPSQGASVLSAANHPQPAIDSAQSSAVAAAAAAKINAMLASKGKLLKSDPPLAKVRDGITCTYALWCVYTLYIDTTVAYDIPVFSPTYLKDAY